MNINRREFLKGSLAALGFLAPPGTPMFAAPVGWKPQKKPNLVFGILSDTHLMVNRRDGKSLYRSMTFDYVRNAFKLFKAKGIDAFLHLGDASHRGCVREWEFHKEVFDEVFGKKDAPEKIIIVGNHELFGNAGHCKGVYRDPEVWKENAICADLPRHYERVWGEPFSEPMHKEVKGYYFFGRHWHEKEYDGVSEVPFANYILEKSGECSLKGDKPFFILSHRRHHFRFCSALREFPNAVAFFGHWHQSNADYKTIYYDSFGGFFPNIQVGACRMDGSNALDGNERVTKGDGVRECVVPDGKAWQECKNPSRQAMIVNVYDDVVVFERHEVGKGGKLGPDWVLPLNWGTGNGKRGTAPHPFRSRSCRRRLARRSFRQRRSWSSRKGQKRPKGQRTAILPLPSLPSLPSKSKSPRRTATPIRVPTHTK